MLPSADVHTARIHWFRADGLSANRLDPPDVP